MVSIDAVGILLHEKGEKASIASIIFLSLLPGSFHRDERKERFCVVSKLSHASEEYAVFFVAASC